MAFRRCNNLSTILPRLHRLQLPVPARMELPLPDVRRAAAVENSQRLSHRFHHLRRLVLPHRDVPEPQATKSRQADAAVGRCERADPGR